MAKATTTEFIHWLREQHTRKDGVGNLARAVRNDPRGETLATSLDLSKRLNQDEASWELHDALEEAEAEWKAEAHA